MKIKYLFIIFIILILVSCNKEENIKIENKKKITKEFLDLKLLPIDSTFIGFINFKEIVNLNWFIKLIKDGALLNDVDITFDETTFLSFFFNIDEFIIRKDFRGGIILKNVNLSIKNIRKKKKYNGVKINVLDEDIAFSVVNNDFLIGTTLELQKEIDISLGKLRTLASTVKNKSFKNIISKLSIDNFLKIAFIPNNKLQNLLRKNSLKNTNLSNFLNNLYGISLGLKINKKNKVIISVVINSNKKGILEIYNLIKSFKKRIHNNVTNKEISYFFSKTKLEKKDQFLYTKTVIPHSKLVEYIIYWYTL